MPLHIIATAKQVLDPETPISAYRLNREAKRVDTDPVARITPVINGFDENGVEAALRIKDSEGDTKVTVLSAGSSIAMDVMKKALAMGSDEMVLVQDDGMENISDSAITAKVLAAAIKKIGDFDLIIAGRAKPSFVVSHDLSLDQAPNAYTKFDRREDGYTKVILHP